VSGVYVKPSSDPTGTEELLLGEETAGLTDWSRDGRFILLDRSGTKNSPDVWVLPVDGALASAGPGRANDRTEGRKLYQFADTEYAERLARFSPRGDWVAYQSNETGRAEIYVRPFPGPGGQARVSIDGGAQPRWRDDGKELYFIAPDAKLMAAGIEVKGSEVIPRLPVALFQTRIYLGGTETPDRGQYDVARDGRFLINTVLDETTLPIIVVQNWAANAR
jgi:dipeptidyl aminopeptidase/acylaminoacyl peptidase